MALGVGAGLLGGAALGAMGAVAVFIGDLFKLLFNNTLQFCSIMTAHTL